jgi:hypothetical protein
MKGISDPSINEELIKILEKTLERLKNGTLQIYSIDQSFGDDRRMGISFDGFLHDNNGQTEK